MNIEALDQLEAELARVARERRRRPRRKLVVAAAVLSACLAGGAAAAVTGVLDPDDPLTRLFDAEDKTLVLSGIDSRGKGWQIVAGHHGDAFCMSMRNDAVGPEAHPTSSSQCGGITPGTLEAAIGGTDVAFAYGTLPDEAAGVVIEGDGRSRAAMVADDDHELPGKFFAVEIPRSDRGAVVVTVKDASGATLAAQRLSELLRGSAPTDGGG